MDTIDEIKKAVSELSETDFKIFRSWFAEFDAEMWDRQIEADMAAGRLDALADEALAYLGRRRGAG